MVRFSSALDAKLAIGAGMTKSIENIGLRCIVSMGA
jgi:hypothetical protein